MAIMIREDLSSKEGLNVTWNYHAPLNVSESIGSDPISPDSIMVDYEAIHVGPTRNYTWYTETALTSSIPTWTKPYLRPLIMHHNEKDGKIIGRIHLASYNDKNTLSGTGALLLTANVSDKEGKEGVKDGRLKTTSIGAIVHEAHCSICNHDIAENGPCEHERGAVYDGKVCYWMITKMEAKELSYVIVPSDIYSQHVKVYKPSKSVTQIKESLEGGMSTVADLTTTEATTIDENGEQKQPEAAPATPVEPTVPAEPTVDVSKLESEISTLKQEKSELEDEVKELNKTLKAEQESKLEAEKQLKDTQVLLTKANNDITTVRAELTTKESELQKEVQLRESLEGQLITDKATKRNTLVESVVELREKLGKRAIEKDDLAKKSDEYLQESLLDLQEEIEAGLTITTKEAAIQTLPEPVVNPGVVENKDKNTDLNVKEHTTVSNMNIEEAMKDIMSAFMEPSKYSY